MAIDPALQALINADPAYSNFSTNSLAASQADKTQRNSSLQRAMEDFGQMPDLYGAASQLGLDNTDLSQIATPEAQALAAANTNAGTSTVAQLAQQRANAVRNITNALASRNMLRSGDTGYSMGQQDLASTQAQYNARKTLLDYLGGIQAGFAAAEHQRQLDLASQFTDAYGRVLAQYPNGLPGTGSGDGSGGTGAGAGGAPGTPANPYPTPPPGAIVTDPTTGTQDSTHGGPVTPAPAYVPPPAPYAGPAYTAPVIYAPQAPPPPTPPPAPAPYNPYGVKSGANIYR